MEYSEEELAYRVELMKEIQDGLEELGLAEKKEPLLRLVKESNE